MSVRHISLRCWKDIDLNPNNLLTRLSFFLSLTNVQEVEERLNAVMLDIRQWSNPRKLKLNKDRTACLFVGRELDREKLTFSP